MGARALFLAPVAPALAVVLLAGCGRGTEPQAEATNVPKALASAGTAVPVVESSYGTPVEERVATLGFLNKRNNLTQDIVLKSGEARRIGNAVIKLSTCEKTLPWERPQEEGAFVQLYVEERATNDAPLAWHKVFSGWLFKNSPSLNAVEHPVYDVWVKSCAMKFPGEEEEAASSSSAAKASGKARAAPGAAATAPAEAPAEAAPPEEAPPPEPQ
jgi:hypothetical protein